tara:strand:- start:1035 stop:1334 length:300 start_codon:yes stop_codon:yes gene_type:complete
MIQNIKSFILGFLVAGVLFCFLPAVASVAEVEKQISKFVGSFKCRLVEVQDIDLWGGRVLVKSNDMGLSFVMIAKDSATYDICPVGVGVTSLKAIPPKK